MTEAMLSDMGTRTGIDQIFVVHGKELISKATFKDIFFK
jgi:hypothetical protein